MDEARVWLSFLALAAVATAVPAVAYYYDVTIGDVTSEYGAWSGGTPTSGPHSRRLDRGECLRDPGAPGLRDERHPHHQHGGSGSNENGDIFVFAPVSWTTGATLTLSAHRDIRAYANITATGDAAGLSINPGRGFSISAGCRIVLSGAAPALAISGYSYTWISDLNALKNIGANLSGHYALRSDIDASATAGWNGGAGFVPLGGDETTPFTGAFDGLGHTISGLVINRPGTDYVGLFGYSFGTIRNVGLFGGSVTGHTYVGGLAGYSNWGPACTPVEIASCTNTGTVTGHAIVGGLAGFIEQGSSIRYSYSTGPVTGSGESSTGLGGLVGTSSGSVEYSYSSGPVNSLSANYSGNLGGLAGDNAGSVVNCYSTGAVTASGTYSEFSGGLAGLNSGSIAKSYSTGAVTCANYTGGLLGYNDGTMDQCYWDTQTSQPATQAVGGGPSAGSGGLTTSQMMSLWLRDPDWFTIEGRTRPFLASEYSPNVTNAHQLQFIHELFFGALPHDEQPGFTLARDIDMGELTRASGMWNTATGFVPLVRATCTLDGGGHTIGGLIVNQNLGGGTGAGLFSNLSSGGTIRNVGLTGVIDPALLVMPGRKHGGMLLGSIVHCYSTGAVTGSPTVQHIGGLVGWSIEGSIAESYSRCAVNGTGTLFAGGLVGELQWVHHEQLQHRRGEWRFRSRRAGGVKLLRRCRQQLLGCGDQRPDYQRRRDGQEHGGDDAAGDVFGRGLGH